MIKLSKETKADDGMNDLRSDELSAPDRMVNKSAWFRICLGYDGSLRRMREVQFYVEDQKKQASQPFEHLWNLV